tara:strand:- start:573 stop:1652 length:1080 start_codon:yes stop_codon:yes gene_type:complete
MPLIEELILNEYDVALIAPIDDYTELIKRKNIRVLPWMVSRNSINPLKELIAVIDLIIIYKRERPSLVHHFTIKACLYGTIAAKIAGVYKVVNAITGLGHVFLGNKKRNRILRQILRPIYRAVFMARRGRVVFQNADDQERLIKLGITDNSRSRLIRGSGVDINYFCVKNDNAGIYQIPLRILFPSRIIKEKGIEELLQACQMLWVQGKKIELFIAGEIDDGNRSTLNQSELEAIKAEHRIHCLGHVQDMRTQYENSDLVVLPSWREGLSRSLIEAASMERPIITTDVPGCRDVIDHGKSGILVPLKDAKSIALAIDLLMGNPDLARSFGKSARKKVVEEFQVSFVNETTIQQYKSMHV